MRLTALKRIAIALVVLLLAYAATGFLLAPWLLQRQVPGLLQERLGRAVTVGEFRANPFLLTLEARDVAVAGAGREPMLSIGRLQAAGALGGLLRGAIALRSVQLDGVRVHVVRQPDGALDLAEAARHWSRVAAPSGGDARKVAIDRISMPDARIAYTDRSGPEVAEAALGPVDLEVDGLSTAGDELARHQLTAALPQGGSLTWEGELGFQPSVHGSGRVQVRGAHAATAWPFLRRFLALADVQATLDASTRYALPPGGALRLTELSVDVSGIRVTRVQGSEPLFQAGHFTAGGGAVDLAQRTVHIARVSVADGSARVERSADGRLDWSGLLAEDARDAARPVQGGAAQRPDAWTVELPEVGVQRMDIRYADGAAQPPLRLEAHGVSAAAHVVLKTGAETVVAVQDVQASTRSLDLRAPASGLSELKLGATTLRQGRFDSAGRKAAIGSLRIEGGDVVLLQATSTRESPKGGGGKPGTDAPWTLAIEQLKVVGVGGRLLPAAQDASPPLVVGTVDGSLRLDVELGGEHTSVVASEVDAQARDVAMAMPGKVPAARLAKAQVSRGRVDLAARRIGAETVALSGSATVVRGADGRLLLPTLLAPGPGPRDREAAPGTRQAWQYAIDHLQVPSLQLAYLDHSFAPALRVEGALRGDARHVASGRPGSFDVGLDLAKGGTVAANGTFDPAGSAAQAKLRVDGVALRPLQPLLSQYAALEVRSGALSAAVDLSYGGGQSPPAIRAGGRGNIAALELVEARTGDPFLACRSLGWDGASLDLGARRLDVRDVTVAGLQAKIEVSEDRKLNLAQVVGGPAFDQGSGESAQPPNASPFRIAVNRVALREGEVDFADRSLVLPFSTTVRGLEGTLVDLSNEPGHRAGVQARGTIAPYGSASVDGSLVPSNPAGFTDLRVRFANVQVPPLSPYTATFAGRKVKSGKLWLDLDYRIEAGALLGKNDIRLSDFSLGEPVAAPNALDIPVDLVVALLSDGDGDIKLSVPLKGELGDAHFSVGSAVRQAIGNVFKRVVSAPFRLLGDLFGGKSESLAAIDFPPGTARLRPEQKEKLDTLVRALRERPKLHLVVSAPYDPARDAEVLQQEQARRAVARAAGRPANADPDLGTAPIAYDDPATRAAIERLLREQAGSGAVEDVRQRLAGRPAREVAQAWYERLASTQALPDGAARMLAIDRARTITGYLQEHGMDPSRLQTGRLAAAPAGKDGDITASLELAAATATR